MVSLRKAKITDLVRLEYWDTQEHVIASGWPDEDWEWEIELAREPAWREQLIAELNGRPIGILQIIDPHLEETHYWGNVGSGKRAIDIWIGEKEDLGKGYGTRMMQLALERCFAAKEVEEVLIDPLKSNIRAIKFYRSIGFTFVEDRMFGEEECAVYVIDRASWEE